MEQITIPVYKDPEIAYWLKKEIENQLKKEKKK